MTNIESQTILRIFGMENMCIWILTQDIPDWKYVTTLGKPKVIGKERNSQKKGGESFTQGL